MNNSAKLGIAALFSAALVLPATANYDRPMNLSVRAGLFLSQSDGKRAEGQNWFTIGAEYKLGDLAFGASSPAGAYNAYYTLSVDYYGKGSFTNVPVLLNYVGRFPDFYYSAGAGVGFGHRRIGSSSDSSIDFNYQLSIGRDFNLGANAVFAEIRYFGNTRTALQGIAIVGGVRF